MQPQRALLTSLDGKHGCLPKIVQIYRNATPRQPRRYICSEKLGQSKSQSLGGTLRYREKPLANKLVGPNRNLIKDSNTYSCHRTVGDPVNVDFPHLHPAFRRKIAGVRAVRVFDEYYDRNTPIGVEE